VTEENEQADYLSKLSNHYDFSLSNIAFKNLERRWGVHSIDRCSLDENVMVVSGRYNSKFWRTED
jgi:hypothetical protein